MSIAHIQAAVKLPVKIAKATPNTARKIVHRHSHEIIVALGPLLADFHFYVFGISVVVIAGLYIYEDIRGIDST